MNDEQIERFLANALAKAGAEELITPREIIRDYLTLLNILRDNPNADFETLIDKVTFSGAEAPFANIDTSRTSASPNKKVTIFDIDI